jgi:hypothetical protein
LGQLFRLGAFLSALGQQAARNAGVPLGVLRLVSCWQGGRLPQRVPLALHVGGLLLQGALFDGHSLSPAWKVGVGDEVALCKEAGTVIRLMS